MVPARAVMLSVVGDAVARIALPRVAGRPANSAAVSVSPRDERTDSTVMPTTICKVAIAAVMNRHLSEM
jgi:hypothetical protein